MTEPLAVDAQGEQLLSFVAADENQLDRPGEPPLTASLVVIHRGPDVLLVFDRWKQLWELPGGGREPGETPRLTATRELAEESGVVDAELDFAGVSSYEFPGGRRERLAIYRAEITDDPVPRFVPNDEIAEIRWWQSADPADIGPALDPLDAALISTVRRWMGYSSTTFRQL